MSGIPEATAIILTTAERTELEVLARSTKTEHRLRPPTRASWLNQVEIWFSILQAKSLCDESFTSVKQLREHIDNFVDAYNSKAKPFVWTKSEVHQKRLKARFADQ
jgi:hypothetical protein